MPDYPPSIYPSMFLLNVVYQVRLDGLRNVKDATVAQLAFTPSVITTKHGEISAGCLWFDPSRSEDDNFEKEYALLSLIEGFPEGTVFQLQRAGKPWSWHVSFEGQAVTAAPAPPAVPPPPVAPVGPPAASTPPPAAPRQGGTQLRDLIELHRACYLAVSGYVELEVTAAAATLFIQANMANLGKGFADRAKQAGLPVDDDGSLPF